MSSSGLLYPPGSIAKLVLDWLGGTTDRSPDDGGHRTSTSAAIVLEPGSTPANGRESAISVEGPARRFGNLEACPWRQRSVAITRGCKGGIKK